MLFKIINNNWIKKIIMSTLLIYITISILTVTYAENYEWSVINAVETIETTGKVEGELSSLQNQNNVINDNAKDVLNLDCGSAILIEQTTRSNFI